MLNLNQKLSEIIFTDKMEMRPTRDGYGEGLLRLGGEDENVVVLTADLAESTRVEEFSKKYPERFFECGVAEQAMATVAAGLGISGKTPFISSYATFSPGRNWEQIRTTIAYNDSNVKIAGHHAGLSTGPDGATHQATEDIAIMRAMPNMKVIVPCDAIEAKKATVAAAKIWGPVYLRFGREKSPIITTEETPFTIGKAEVFYEARGAKVLIVACGLMVYKALEAARELQAEKFGVTVLNCHTIKPLDEKKIVDFAKKCGSVVVAEEHQIAGGLGGAVAELLAKKCPVPMEFVGLNDVFGESGRPDELLKKYEMDTRDIKEAVKRVAARRK